MAGRIATLNAAKGGISRLRVKGSPSPNTLYDLLNGYPDASGSINARPGTVERYALPTNTKGMIAFNGGLVVFSHAAQTVPAGVTCEILTHPTIAGLTLAEIHFAGPFLGYLYVVAEWSNGDVFHYWQQAADTWTANTVYAEGTVVQPTTPNGYAYVARRIGEAGVPWAANVARTVGDKVEPTTPNGYEYTVVATIGDSPRSGTVEPTWPEADGALVNEDVYGVPAPVTTPTDPGPGTPPPSVVDRYGSGPGNHRIIRQIEQ